MKGKVKAEESLRRKRESEMRAETEHKARGESKSLMADV